LEKGLAIFAGNLEFDFGIGPVRQAPIRYVPSLKSIGFETGYFYQLAEVIKAKF
jgi:hypothetical protein